MVAERVAIEGLLRRLWGGWALKRGATALGCGLLLFLTMPRAQAASELGTPGALFEVAVPVVDQGTRTRARAERSALEILLKRLSPAPGLTSRPSIALALRDPDQYYRSASYAPGGALSPWLLTLQFDREAILSLLAQAELPAWVSQRPRYLLWLVEESEDGQRRLLDAEHPLARAVVEAGRERAVPLAVPLLDLKELQQVAPWQVWGRFWGVLKPLRERYGAEGELILRLRAEGDGWYVDYEGEGLPMPFSGALRTEAPTVALRAVGQGLADALLERFALSLTGEASRIAYLRLDGLKALGAYAEALAVLEALVGVAEVFVLEAQDDAVLFRLAVTDTPERVFAQLNRDRRFEAGDPNPALAWQGRWKG